MQNTLTDVTLACDGKTYPVHKLVLVTCSEYFCSILSDLQCQHPVIYLRGVKSREVEALLDFMYIGETDIPQCEVPNLLSTAESLQIKGLGVNITSDIENEIKNETKNESKIYRKRQASSKSKDLSKLSNHGIREEVTSDSHSINQMNKSDEDDKFSNSEPISKRPRKEIGNKSFHNVNDALPFNDSSTFHSQNNRKTQEIQKIPFNDYSTSRPVLKPTSIDQPQFYNLPSSHFNGTENSMHNKSEANEIKSIEHRNQGIEIASNSKFLDNIDDKNCFPTSSLKLQQIVESSNSKLDNPEFRTLNILLQESNASLPNSSEYSVSYFLINNLFLKDIQLSILELQL